MLRTDSCPLVIAVVIDILLQLLQLLLARLGIAKDRGRLLGLGHRVYGRGNRPWLQLQAWPLIIVWRHRMVKCLDESMTDSVNLIVQQIHRQ